MSPSTVNRILQLFPMPWMQLLHRSSRGGELLLKRHLPERSSLLFVISSHDDARRVHQPARRIPHGARSLAYKRQASINVVVLLPEPPTLPSHFVTTSRRALINY